MKVVISISPESASSLNDVGLRQCGMNHHERFAVISHSNYLGCSQKLAIGLTWSLPKGRRSMVTRLQHYVAQFHLRRWGADKRNFVHVLDKANQRIFLANPRDIGGERFVHSTL